jgi:hypothetical protein
VVPLKEPDHGKSISTLYLTPLSEGVREKKRRV